MTDNEFWARVDMRDDGDCWPWKGARICGRRFGSPGNGVPAHRRAFELHSGEDLTGQWVGLNGCPAQGLASGGPGSPKG